MRFYQIDILEEFKHLNYFDVQTDSRGEYDYSGDTIFKFKETIRYIDEYFKKIENIHTNLRLSNLDSFIEVIEDLIGLDCKIVDNKLIVIYNSYLKLVSKFNIVEFFRRIKIKYLLENKI